MKITKQEISQTGFKPFKLEISVESQEEAQALYAIFNNTDNSRLLPGLNLDEDIGEEFYIDDGQDCQKVIARGITYGQFYHNTP